ncbi:hypothetical protein C2S52_001898 [Perilla frutescens var. hirtella]|nr:hypothetical protein C2S52_001898 [Perilla frutescens var. hirtella]
MDLSTVNINTSNRSNGQSMYRAASEGDWLAAEIILQRDPNLAFDHITEDGDRALHVAAAMKHKQFVQKLVEKMSSNDLTLLDGNGYTACCYAAMTGIVEMADIMRKKNPSLGTARDKYGKTPLHKAASRAKAGMLWYFLNSAEVADLSKEEWFDLLLVTIDNGMYDLAFEILEKDGSLATMRNDEGTALHLLARLDITSNYFKSKQGRNWMRNPLIFFPVSSIKVDEMQPDQCFLAEKLWTEIQREPNVLELMKNPPILHEAAKVGNVELITMVTRDYPNLVWKTDNNRYTIFHIAVIYRRENVFRLIHQIGARRHFVAISIDENGNNILHLAAKLAPLNARKISSDSLMQREVKWFKVVEDIVPPPCRDMKNRDGHTPRELFSIEHKALLEKGETWMKNTADSCMLVATILLTVVFAAAFTVPGGNNGETGIPIHLKSKWFTTFIINEAVALLGSTGSMVMFWTIMTSSFEEDEFMMMLPNQLMIGLLCLLLALIHAISAFVVAYFVVFVKARAGLVISVIALVYGVLFCAIFFEFNRVWLNLLLPVSFSRTLSFPTRHNLFGRHDTRHDTTRYYQKG